MISSRLVSDHEDSSSESSDILSPIQTGRKEYNQTDSDTRHRLAEEENASNRKVQLSTGKSEDKTTDIKNELIKSKITLNASVILNRLPPDANKLITKLEEQTNNKVTIRCVPIASAPEIKPNIFKISDHQPFSTLIKFLTKKLKKKLETNGVIYCYINNAFLPSPDEIVGDLYKHFGNNNELVISYSTMVAFG